MQNISDLFSLVSFYFQCDQLFCIFFCGKKSPAAFGRCKIEDETETRILETFSESNVIRFGRNFATLAKFLKSWAMFKSLILGLANFLTFFSKCFMLLGKYILL